MQTRLRPGISTLSAAILSTAILFAAAVTTAAAQEMPGGAAQAVVGNADSPDSPDHDGDDLKISSSSGRLQLQTPKVSKAHWADLLREHIAEFGSNTDPQNITPALIRRLRADISNILATEGYFNPQIDFENSAPDTGKPASPADNSIKLIHVSVDAGPRTIIDNVSIKVFGPLSDAIDAGDKAAIKRRRALQEDWGLGVGQPFRENDWSSAKNQMLESLRGDAYAAATITDSEAKIDADNDNGQGVAQPVGMLRVEVDSGPVFTLGELHVSGLQRYPAWLIDRYHAPRPGEVYSRARLLDFQRALQNSPYFGTVTVGVDPDPDIANAVPVEVNVVERPARDLSFSAGYSTNTGYRGEVAYRDRDILDKAWDLRSAVRLEQLRQLGYADIYLPPSGNDYLDSFGVLIEKENIAGVRSSRNALAYRRTTTRGHLEQRLGLNLLREKTNPVGEAETISKALVPSIGWTWRDVDQPLDPHKGQILQLDLAGSEKALLSDQRFLRGYVKYQRWIPVLKTDNLIVRAELGEVFSKDQQGIPEDYLFRTGGSTTVRGYAYQSLGIQHVGSTSGGRVMATASAEYVHWLDAQWGAATFLDVGNAADIWRDISLHQGMGVGARYKTPAGPVALDLAYGRQAKKLRLDFSIAIAF